jgi:predicted MFS family arabinose efflux permease
MPISPRPASLRVQVALFTVIRLAVNTSTRMIYPFLAVFARGMGVDLASITLVLTVRALMGALSPLLAPIADSRGRKTSMLLGLGIFTVGAVLVAIWPSYGTFFVAVVIGYLGIYVYLPAMQAYLGDSVPYSQRGQVLAITELGWSVSFIIGVPLAGYLIAHYGWNTPFSLAAVGALLMLGLIAWLVPYIPSSRGVVSGSLNKFWHALSAPSVLAALAFSLVFTCANEVVNVVFGVWMEDSFNLQIAALGAASAVIGFSELGGEGLSVWLVDRLGKERAVAIGLSANALVALVLPWLGRSLPGALVGLGLFYLTFEFAIVCSLPLMTEVLPSARATLMGLNVAVFSLGRALGAALAPHFYIYGFWVNSLASVGFDLLALLALSKIKIGGGTGEATEAEIAREG